MKLLKLLLIFSAFSLLGTFKVSATHVMGSDIQWECIGEDTFRIKVTVYRDCNGIQLGNGPFTISSNCGTMRVSASMSGGEDITPVCDEQCTRCDSRGCTFKYGIQKWVLTGTVVLSTWRKNGCCEVTISWGQCCRNGAITTGAANNNFYVDAKMNICQDPCDNSPTFTGDPLAIICLGRDFIYNQGATDPDVDSVGGLADSLVYKFAEPLQTATSKTAWSSPYSYDKPIYFLGFPKSNLKFPRGLHLDVNTGDLMFRPMKEEQTVVSLQIEEYRNGKRIGYTRRDIQIVVIKCPDNNPPVISGINCKDPKPENFKTDACAGQKLCFTVCTSDKDKDDTVTIGWNGGIPDATFDVLNKGDRRERGRFCWTPDESKVSKFPYNFVVTAKDNACPVNGFSARSFSIIVKAPPKAKYQHLIYNCGNAEFRAQKTGNINISQYMWGISGRLVANKGGKGDTVWHHYKYPGKKPYTLTLIGGNGCNTIYEDTVEIPDYVNVTVSPDMVVCAGATVNVSAIVADASGKYRVKWSTGDSTENKTTSTTQFTVGDTNTYVIAHVKDEYCDNADTVFITVNNPAKFKLGDPARICPGDEHRFFPTIEKDTANPDADSIFTYAWYQDKPNGAVVSTFDTITVKDSARYYLKVIDSLQCSSIDSIDLFVNPDRNWRPNDEVICFKDSVYFDVKETSPKSRFDWWNDLDTTKPSAFTGERFGHKPAATQYYGIKWSETLFGLTCIEYDSVRVKVNELPNIVPKKPGDVCENEDPFSLQLNATPLGGQWFDTTGREIIKFGQFYPKVAGADGQNPKTHQLFYTYTDPVTQCTDTNNTFIIVRPLPEVKLNEDTVKMCDTEDPRELGQYVEKVFGEGQWPDEINGVGVNRGVVELNGKYYFDPKVVNNVQGFYRLIYKYTNNNTPLPHCHNTDTLVLHLITVPEIEAGVYDSVCHDAFPVSLNKASPSGSTGEWYYIGTDVTVDSSQWTKDDNSFDPTTYDVGTHYLAYRYTVPKSECFGLDTTHVKINPLPKPYSTTFWQMRNGDNKVCIDTLRKILTGNTIENGRAYTDKFWSGRGVGERGADYVLDPRASGEGSNTIIYTVTNHFGCVGRDTVNLIVDGTPEVSFTNEKACVGDTVKLNVTTNNAASLRWTTTGEGRFTDSLGLNTNYIPAGKDVLDSPFVITVITVNDNNVCPAGEDKNSLQVFPLPAVDFIHDSIVCGPSNVIFKNLSSISTGSIRTFTWDFGDDKQQSYRGEVQTFQHVYGVKGDSNTYYPVLTAESDQGCVSSKGKRVITIQTPIAAFTPRPGTTTIIRPEIYFENLTTKTIPGRSRFEWNFDDFTPRYPDGGSSTTQHPSHRYTEVGEYNVMLIATNTARGLECADTLIQPIQVNPEIMIFIPNAFTPDNKGIEKNNTFRPRATDVQDYSVKVYSRWGELMWETTDPDESWDGKKGGVDCKSDVYMYVVQASNLSGQEFEFTGTVTLIR